MNALVSTNFFDVGHSVIGRGQAYPIGANGEAGKTKAGTKLLGVRPLCDGVDDTRPNGTAHSHAGLAG